MSRDIKTGKLLWMEDDATTRDPDHEDLKTAWKRLFGTNFDVVTAPEPELTANIRDFGDECWIFFKSGIIVCSSYPGNNSIYAAPEEIPEGKVRCVVALVDQDPTIQFLDEETIDRLLPQSTLHRWRCRVNELRVWSAVSPSRHTSRADRPQHPSRWRALGGVYPGPAGDMYILGEDNQSIGEDDAAAVVERLQRTSEERLHDAIREWRADPHLSSNLSLALVVDAWMKENP